MRFARCARVLLTLWLAAAGCLQAMQPSAAASMQRVAGAPPLPVSTVVSTSFPEGMTFSVVVGLPDHDNGVETIQLLYRIGSNPTLHLERVDSGDTVVQDGSVSVETFVDLLASFVPLGVDLTFSWEILLANGDVVRTVDEHAQWTDTRFAWDLRRSEHVRLYTWDADPAFADMMLSESQATVDALTERYGVESMTPFSIWIYGDGESFSATWSDNSPEAVSGVTYQGFDAIAGVVPTGNDAEFRRVVLHEISHQVVYVATDNPYGLPPLWFTEGLATRTQVGGTNSYPGTVRAAYESGTLYNIESLETSFPVEPARWSLAYASSWSVMSYIEETWGAGGVARMIDAFAEGMSTDDALGYALGISMDDLNEGWRGWIAPQAGASRPAA